LLKELKPENSDSGNKFKIDNDSSEEDEDVKQILSRKVSMNLSNPTGTNFEKYND
jgi:hypothetical protein